MTAVGEKMSNLVTHMNEKKKGKVGRGRGAKNYRLGCRRSEFSDNGATKNRKDYASAGDVDDI